MGGQSGMGGAAAPQGASPSFGPNMFGAQKPPPGQPAPMVPGTPGRNSDPVQPNNPFVQPMQPPAYSDPGMSGLAKAFMGNQATQNTALPEIMQQPQPGSSLPEIMQPPQSAMPDIAAMLAARKPGVQPIPPTPAPAAPSTAPLSTRDKFLQQVHGSQRQKWMERRNNAGSR